MDQKMNDDKQKKSENIVTDIRKQIKNHKTKAVQKLKEMQKIMECEGESCLSDIEPNGK